MYFYESSTGTPIDSPSQHLISTESTCWMRLLAQLIGSDSFSEVSGYIGIDSLHDGEFIGDEL
jgi:hypothetical protein